MQAYQNHLWRNYNKKLKVRHFEFGDLVLIMYPKNQQVREKPIRFEPNWLGPYVVIAAYKFGTYQIATWEGKQLFEPVNSMYLCKYYTWENISKNILKIEKWSYKISKNWKLILKNINFFEKGAKKMRENSKKNHLPTSENMENRCSR